MLHKKLIFINRTQQFDRRRYVRRSRRPTTTHVIRSNALRSREQRVIRTPATPQGRLRQAADDSRRTEHARTRPAVRLTEAVGLKAIQPNRPGLRASNELADRYQIACQTSHHNSFVNLRDQSAAICCAVFAITACVRPGNTAYPRECMSMLLAAPGLQSLGQ